MARIFKILALWLALVPGAAAPAAALQPGMRSHASFCEKNTYDDRSWLPQFVRELTPPSPKTLSKMIVPICPAGQTAKWYDSSVRDTSYPNTVADYFESLTGRRFLLSETVLTLTLFASMFLLGTGVQNRGWNANYTRKILGAVLLLASFATGYGLPYAANRLTVLGSIAISAACFLLFARPLRERSQFLVTAFASIDRPEDRPHTLGWFVSGFLAGSAVFLTMIWWALPYHYAYGMIAFAAVAVGDLLAGAVGYRYGRYRYATRGFLSSREYSRSIEGSLCVFAVTAVAIWLLFPYMPRNEAMLALLILPPVLTLAEAKSPHTWDEPVMFFAAMITSMTIVKLA